MKNCKTCERRQTKHKFNSKKMEIYPVDFCKYYKAFITEPMDDCPNWKKKKVQNENKS